MQMINTEQERSVVVVATVNLSSSLLPLGDLVWEGFYFMFVS
jgi:hypothetical protein